MVSPDVDASGLRPPAAGSSGLRAGEAGEPRRSRRALFRVARLPEAARRRRRTRLPTIYPDESDQPAREGPFAWGGIDLWKYSFPISAAKAAELAERLGSIPPLLVQQHLQQPH